MYRLTHATQHYAWGSVTDIPDALALPADGRPVAEAWFGAHAAAPATVELPDGTCSLRDLIAADPQRHLGPGVHARFGDRLPYLLKLLAASSPVSLQVHPSIERARAGYAAEDAAGVPRDADHRNYRDLNHKPEMVYALTRFEALVGFRAPRRAAELLVDLDAPLAADLHGILDADPSADGVRAAFAWLLTPATRPTEADVAKFVDACAQRLRDGSPAARTDQSVLDLARAFPGDPGAVTSILLNPVTLQPGEALFVPAGTVHTYLRGLGVELMANSDNVLRAGLTVKHIDVDELLRNVDTVAAPPIRIAAEHVFTSTEMFYAPVDDFELSVTRVEDAGTRVPGRGPRVLLCLDGDVTLHNALGEKLTLTRGRAAFVPAADGALTVDGGGLLVQADVP